LNEGTFEIEFSNLYGMKAKNIFTPLYRQDYFEGYSNGLDPKKKKNGKKTGDAYTSGFESGRVDYESMNDCILNGIPKRIVTKTILEEFLLAGLLGLTIDTDHFTNFQLHVIAKWYQSGIEKYNPEESSYLAAILEENGIEIH
jgi:hypothetical protein